MDFSWFDLVVAAFIGWCGTGWPFHFVPVPTPQPPKPPCLVCGRIAGAIGGIVAVAVLAPHFEGAGLLGVATLGFFGGSFLGDLSTMVTGR
jgi:hypothetical protein